MKYLTWVFAHSDEFFEADEVFDEDLYDTVVSIPEARHSHEMRDTIIGICSEWANYGINAGTPEALAKIDKARELLATIAKEEKE